MPPFRKMYRLEKTFHFEAGHALKKHEGPCKTPHGHRYFVTLHLEFDSVQDAGPAKNMCQDFHEIKAAAKPLIDTYLDHQWLNDSLETDSPTAEFIAKWIFDRLRPKLPHLVGVSVEETASCRASFFF